MRLIPILAFALVLSACGSEKPDARTTPGESKVEAKAVADVDAAMVGARSTDTPAPAESAPTLSR